MHSALLEVCAVLEALAQGARSASQPFLASLPSAAMMFEWIGLELHGPGSAELVVEAAMHGTLLELGAMLEALAQGAHAASHPSSAILPSAAVMGEWIGLELRGPGSAELVDEAAVHGALSSVSTEAMAIFRHLGIDG